MGSGCFSVGIGLIGFGLMVIGLITAQPRPLFLQHHFFFSSLQLSLVRQLYLQPMFSFLQHHLFFSLLQVSLVLQLYFPIGSGSGPPVAGFVGSEISSGESESSPKTFLKALAPLWPCVSSSLQPMHHWPHMADKKKHSGSSAHFFVHASSVAPAPLSLNVRRFPSFGLPGSYLHFFPSLPGSSTIFGLGSSASVAFTRSSVSPTSLSPKLSTATNF